MVSEAYPGLERKPGGPDNWVEAAGGLPKYIERIAKRLHYERGFSISRAIATAVNTVKRWARMGKVAKYGDPNKKRVSAKTAALAARAVAQWEAKKKAGSLALSDDILVAIDLCYVSDEFAIELAEEMGDVIDLIQTCAVCDQPATKKVLWADGRGFQPSCSAHIKAVQDMLTKKNGKMTELAGVQDLSDLDVEATSTMVALMLPEAVANKVAVPDGVPPEDMHVTVLFNGDLSEAGYLDLVAKIKEFAIDWQGGPLKGTIGGLGTFPADDPEKGAPWWIPVDVPGLNTLYEQLTGLVDHASEHGYTPHSTLTYVKDGETPPSPVPSTPVEFTSVWVVRGNEQRIEIPLGTETGADLSGRAILSADDIDLSKGLMDIEALAERANRVADPALRGAARQKVLDLASTIAPRNARGKATDGRNSFKGQGEWKHGFIPVDRAAKEAKAKGSPIAMKRMRRLFGKSKDADAPRAPRPKQRQQVKAATGRAGQRSSGGRKKNPTQVNVDEKSQPGSERAKDIAHLRRTKFDDKAKIPDSKLPGSQKEASKATRIPARATQNWGEIPESLKTVRNGRRYVLAEFGGKQYVTEWVGGVNRTSETALKDRKVMRTLSSADAANMSQAELRALMNNPRTPESVLKVARKALNKLAKEAAK